MSTHPLLALSDHDLGVIAAELVPIHGGLYHTPQHDHTPLWWATAQALALRQWALCAVRRSQVPAADEIAKKRQTRDAMLQSLSRSTAAVPDELYVSVGSRARKWLLATLARAPELLEADARVESLDARRRDADSAVESARRALEYLERTAEEAKCARDSAWFARGDLAYKLGQPREPEHPLPIPDGYPGCDVQGHLHRAVADKGFDYPQGPLPEGY